MTDEPNNPPERLPPQSLRAEKAVLGGLFLDAARLSEVSFLTPEAFLSPYNREMFRQFVACRREHSGKFDLVLFRDWLEARGAMESVGGIETVVEVVESVPSSEHTAHYAKILHDKLRHRDLIQSAHRLLHQAYDEADEDGLRDAARAVRESIQAHDRGLDLSSNVATAGESVGLAMEDILETQEKKSSLGTLTGFNFLDDAGGIFAPELVVVAGVTSSGKTTFACNVAAFVAKNGGAVYCASREDGPAELGKRLIQAEARIDGAKLRPPGVYHSDLTDAWEAKGRIDSWPLLIDGQSSTPGEAQDRAASFRDQHEGKLALAVIDYLQLFRPDSKCRGREEEISAVAWAFKEFARALEVPVLLVSQFRRFADDSGKKAVDPRPTMHHLRGSGDIENHANRVILLHRPDPAVRDESGGFVIEVAMPKNRGGEQIHWPKSGEEALTLRYFPWQMRFENRPPPAPELEF